MPISKRHYSAAIFVKFDGEFGSIQSVHKSINPQQIFLSKSAFCYSLQTQFFHFMYLFV